ncbi:nucleotide-binding protein [Pseudomonas sp. NMI795_08]|uniref:nucleotide-binding protein n=1 Tax=Pseudomonas sp. NMI795_08 TaxID=2903144 RepID=UPI001E42E09F|nr:division plane positioning ATPase MipZ [Pseudomonas sp. NMI795_08]MCE1119080.1 ParA family protein [Pseudomonas sp. NMI795_08]
MGSIYSVLSKKGGPGKSTIARALGVALAQNEWAVKIADFDLDQMTSTNWVRRRLAGGHKPELAAEVFGSLPKALRQANDYDALIIDGAAAASTMTAEIAKASDLVILPTGLCLDDLQPTAELAEALHAKHGVPAERIVFALNHAGDSAAELSDAQAYLRKTRFALMEGPVQQKVSYSRAHDLGLSIIETPAKGPREKAELLIQSIVNRINELTI